jgi:hypothetical protein
MEILKRSVLFGYIYSNENLTYKNDKMFMNVFITCKIQFHSHLQILFLKMTESHNTIQFSLQEEVSRRKHIPAWYYNFITLHTVSCISITYIYFQPHLHTCSNKCVNVVGNKYM